MANILVKLDHEMLDGEEVKFVAPCDCTAVTGVQISYPEESGEDIVFKTKNFSFCDAHGNNLTGLGNLFVAGAIVKVILSVGDGFAYIQNAATNGYLESQFARLEGIGNECIWDKRTKEIRETTEEVEKTSEDSAIGQIMAMNMYAYTSDTFPETGYGVVSNLPTTGTQGFGFHVENWERVNLSFSATAVDNLKKYFWIPNINDSSFTPYKTYIYEKDANTTATATTVMPNQYLDITGAGYWRAIRKEIVTPSEHVAYVNSRNPDAYPVDDGYDYVYIGQIGELLERIKGGGS